METLRFGNISQMSDISQLLDLSDKNDDLDTFTLINNDSSCLPPKKRQKLSKLTKLSGPSIQNLHYPSIRARIMTQTTPITSSITSTCHGFRIEL